MKRKRGEGREGGEEVLQSQTSEGKLTWHFLLSPSPRHLLSTFRPEKNKLKIVHPWYMLCCKLHTVSHVRESKACCGRGRKTAKCLGSHGSCCPVHSNEDPSLSHSLIVSEKNPVSFCQRVLCVLSGGFSHPI